MPSFSWKSWRYLGLLLAVPLSAHGEDSFSIRVSPVGVTSTSAKVEVVLKYEGTKPVQVEASSLPGGRIEPLDLEARQYPASSLKEPVACPGPQRRIVIDDPGTGERTVLPGQEFSQVIDLNETIPNVAEILGVCDLVLYWSYLPVLANDRYVERAAGVLQIPASLRVSPTAAQSMVIRRSK